MSTRTPIVDGAVPASIARAASVLRSGGLVAIPTETVYGLAADALNPAAVARVYVAKARPSFDPLIVHVADSSEVSRVAEVPEALRGTLDALAARFWPGPLTVILPRRAGVPDLVTSGLPDVAVRVPAHPVARAIVREAGVPLAAPSANPFGYVSPTTAAHVAAQLDGRIDLIVDGGACAVGVESTVVTLATDPPELLRPGGVSIEALREVLPTLVDGVRVMERPLAPGQLARHYATRTPLRMLGMDGSVPEGGARAATLLVALGDGGPVASGYGEVIRLSASGDASEAAARLFAVLRGLDGSPRSGVDVLPCAAEGLGRAIVDRLSRAAAPAVGEASLSGGGSGSLVVAGAEPGGRP